MGILGFGLTNPKDSLKKLDLLIERINASIDEDVNASSTVAVPKVNINLFPRRTKRYLPATVREIEEELKNIINEITDTKILNNRFIFVLDELDKLQFDSDTYDSSNLSRPNSLHTPDSNKVFQLLGQLKYFTSSTNAKFVFIAGHDLYDSYLADVSDREFFVSSMFNGVINVDSFFTKNSKTKDVTRLTEEYVCRILLGSSNNEEEITIKKYIQNLDRQNKELNEKIAFFLKQFITYLTFISNGAPKKLSSHFQKYVITDEQYKAYRDNNENRKVYEYIEQRGCSNSKAKYYLSFGHYSQQHIGFINYIASPIFNTIISPSSEYGDKLLVSSAFMISHIYKLHSSGFSWRNFEYLPELIAGGQTPELRGYLGSMLGYLSQLHITSITSGINDYKFPLRLAEEISIFTKRSEEISAIFNFSLDDTFEVKRYYHRLIDSKNQSQVEVANIHHYLGDIHMSSEEYTEAIFQYKLAADIIRQRINKYVIGGSDDMAQSSTIVRYARVILKLGLCYEKRNTNDSAYMIYNDLTLNLIQYREINESTLGLQCNVSKEQDHKSTMNYRLTLTRDNAVYAPLDKFNKFCYPSSLSKDTFKHKTIDYWINSDELADNLSDFINPTKAALISKLSVFEDLRVAYLPILAKIFAIEKHKICGITKDNVKIAESEFNYMFLITNSQNKYLLAADFYRKLGDILYYKNKNFYPGESVGSAFSAYGYDIRLTVFNYCHQNKIDKDIAEKVIELVINANVDSLEVCLDHKKDNERYIELNRSIVDGEIASTEILKIANEALREVNKQVIDKLKSMRLCSKNRKAAYDTYSNNCSACRFYNRSLIILKDKTIKKITNLEVNFIESSWPKSIKFLCAIKTNNLANHSYNDLFHTALALEAMGNVLLSCKYKDESNLITHKFVDILLLMDKNLNVSNVDAIIGTYAFTNIERALSYYYAAYEYYRSALSPKSSQCLTKILNVLEGYYQVQSTRSKEPLVLSTARKGKEVLNFLSARVSDVIEETYKMKECHNIIEIKQTNKAFNEAYRLNLGNTSMMPDIEELIFALYEVKLRYSDFNDVISLIKNLYKSPSLTYFRNESLSYNRIISLVFKARLNEYIYEKIFSHSIAHESISLNIIKDLFGVTNITLEGCQNFLISDARICLVEVIGSITSNKKSTLFTESFLGGIYRSLSYWQGLYNNLTDSRKDNIKNIMLARIDLAQMDILSYTYLSEMANKHYASAYKMNREGKIYQDFINNFYILDDNLQNNTCQFYIALERYKINEGLIDKSCIEINKDDYPGYYDPDMHLVYGEQKENEDSKAQ